MFHPRRFRVLLCSSILLVGLAGCGGPKGVPVKGKLIMPSTTKLVETDDVQISFVPEGSAGKPAVATYSKADQSFAFSAGKVKGVVPGKYKVVLKITPYPGMPESAKREPAFDALNTRYSLAKTNLNVEIPAGDQPVSVTVDLDKSQVTKN